MKRKEFELSSVTVKKAVFEGHQDGAGVSSQDPELVVVGTLSRDDMKALGITPAVDCDPVKDLTLHSYGAGEIQLNGLTEAGSVTIPSATIVGVKVTQKKNKPAGIAFRINAKGYERLVSEWFVGGNNFQGRLKYVERQGSLEDSGAKSTKSKVTEISAGKTEKSQKATTGSSAGPKTPKRRTASGKGRKAASTPPPAAAQASATVN